jgi:hypothetical protein
MGISQDRWTCPTCDRTHNVGGDPEEIRAALIAVQQDHAEEHTRAPAPERVTAPGRRFQPEKAGLTSADLGR